MTDDGTAEYEPSEDDGAEEGDGAEEDGGGEEVDVGSTTTPPSNTADHAALLLGTTADQAALLQKIKEMTAQAAGHKQQLAQARRENAALTASKAAKNDNPDPVAKDDVWWAHHPEFPEAFKNLPRCTVNPVMNGHARDSPEEARVRRATSLYYRHLGQAHMSLPEEPNGAFHQVPSELLIKMMTHARAAPYNLPWNAWDVDARV